MITPSSATGYGPSLPKNLQFNGDVSNYELWEVKFMGHLRLQKLHHIFEGSVEDVEENDNATVFAQLVQLLDDRSLSLII